MREERSSLKQKPQRRTTEGEITDERSKTVAPDNGIETLTRKDLGKLFNVSHEAIRLWEESGRLKELGWERAGHIKSPVKYSRTNQPAAPAPLTSVPDNSLALVNQRSHL